MINLIRNVKDLYNENAKTLMKETEDIKKETKKSMFSTTGGINTPNVYILSPKFTDSLQSPSRLQVYYSQT